MNNRCLEIDLHTQTFRTRTLEEKVLKQYLGGRGLGARLLYEYTTAGEDPLAGSSPMIITTGLLAGSGWPSAVQWHVTEKSSLTGGIRSSLAWGRFGIVLHSLGYAAVIIQGRSETPVYLHLAGKEVRFKNAEAYQGTDTQVFAARMAEVYTGSSSLAIGRAGEAMTGLAAAIADGYSMTLRGCGTIMGSKRLKGIVAEPGEYTPSWIQEKEWLSLSEVVREKVATHQTSVRLRDVGKALFISSKNLRGDWPTRNYQQPSFEMIENFNAEAIKDITVGTKSCESCDIGCIRKTRTERVDTEGLELEPIWTLGARIGNGDLAYLVDLYDRCLKDGVDPSGFGGIVAFAMECSQRGILPRDYRVQWGNPEDIDRLWEEMIEDKGLGGMLRNGTRKFCEAHPECLPYAMQVKGVELSAQEPRQSQTFGLNNAVSSWGGDGLYALPTLDVANNVAAMEVIAPELLPDALETHTPTHKGAVQIISEEVNALSDSLGICKFACPESYAIMPSDLAEAWSHIFKEPMDAKGIMTLGDGIIEMERLFNLREGISPEEDRLPERFLTEPITVDIYDGDRLKGLVKTGETRTCLSFLDEMKEEYYALRGWDGGIPADREAKEAALEGEKLFV